MVQKILFLILAIAMFYAISADVIAGIRSFRVCRWIQQRDAEAWRKMPWFFRTIGARDVALKLFLRNNSISDPEFNAMYKGVKRIEIHSWISLGVALASLLLGIVLGC